MTAPSILWAGIVRNGIVLAQTPAVNQMAAIIARRLLDEIPTLGWDSAYGPSLKGIKFNLYQDDDRGKILHWAFACVYDSTHMSRLQTQVIIEQMMIQVTESSRENYFVWKAGNPVACQGTFGLSLQKLVERMSNETLGALEIKRNLELCKHAIARNRRLLRQRIDNRNVYENQDQGDAVFRDWIPPKEQLLRGWKTASRGQAPAEHSPSKGLSRQASASDEDEDVVSVDDEYYSQDIHEEETRTNTSALHGSYKSGANSSPPPTVQAKKEQDMSSPVSVGRFQYELSMKTLSLSQTQNAEFPLPDNSPSIFAPFDLTLNKSDNVDTDTLTCIDDDNQDFRHVHGDYGLIEI